MGLRATVAAAATLCASACIAQDDLRVGPPMSAEIVRTYRAEIGDLFRCFIGLTPELRHSASGWTMRYTDLLAVIDGPFAEIDFRPAGPGETEMVVTGAGDPYRLFHPGRWTATAEACARGSDGFRASAPEAWPAEPDGAVRGGLPLRSRM